MINQFKQLNPLNILFLALFTFFMRLAIFINQPASLQFEFLEPFAKFFIQTPSQSYFSTTANLSLAALVVFVQALIFNRIINNHNLLGKPSYLPALLYVTGTSLFLQFFILSPPLLCNFLLIWIMNKFLNLGKASSALSILFDVGMIIAVGTLMYFPFIVFLAMLWLSLLLYRAFNWREWLVGIFGFLTIFLFVAVFYYWNDNLSQFYQIWRPLTNKFPSLMRLNLNDYVVLLPIAIILILAALQLRNNFFRSFIATRKAFQMLFFMFLVALISFYAKTDFKVFHFLLSVAPGAVFLAYYFANAKTRWIYESLFAVLVIAIQYFLFV
jgi:hypothetical protein